MILMFVTRTCEGSTLVNASRRSPTSGQHTRRSPLPFNDPVASAAHPTSVDPGAASHQPPSKTTGLSGGPSPLSLLFVFQQEACVATTLGFSVWPPSRGVCPQRPTCSCLKPGGWVWEWAHGNGRSSFYSAALCFQGRAAAAVLPPPPPYVDDLPINQMDGVGGRVPFCNCPRRWVTQREMETGNPYICY
ncbi:hypothetical protein LX32DRAFT_449369 [Colletotrichum zoysiae]|uniref:Uncharacterized protein n=1 Tax=Colletotrichum zoysiae TaxID=1216348 RepID=A0AAD9HDV5_9PEZI|nr:hypothetical protein LX32DRAFT_449369 [Colletotrichum zoysiae]